MGMGMVLTWDYRKGLEMGDGDGQAYVRGR